jgi:hypothetical protein
LNPLYALLPGSGAPQAPSLEQGNSKIIQTQSDEDVWFEIPLEESPKKMGRDVLVHMPPTAAAAEKSVVPAETKSWWGTIWDKAKNGARVIVNKASDIWETAKHSLDEYVKLFEDYGFYRDLLDDEDDEESDG